MLGNNPTGRRNRPRGVRISVDPIPGRTCQQNFSCYGETCDRRPANTLTGWLAKGVGANRGQTRATHILPGAGDQVAAELCVSLRISGSRFLPRLRRIPAAVLGKTGRVHAAVTSPLPDFANRHESESLKPKTGRAILLGRTTSPSPAAAGPPGKRRLSAWPAASLLNTRPNCTQPRTQLRRIEPDPGLRIGCQVLGICPTLSVAIGAPSNPATSQITG